MTKTTFIHTSDLQLGMKRKFLRPEAQSRFDDARLRAVERVGELARERGAEFIVVAGDVFEHNSLESSTFGRAKEVLRALPVPVYLLPGNHDPLVADSILARAAEADGVHVITDSQPLEVAEGVELIGAPLTAKHAAEDLCARAVRGLEPTERIRVLVGHGAVEGFGDEDTAAVIDIGVLEPLLRDGTLDYVALGDTHSTHSLGRTGKIWYSGSPETTDYLERGAGEVAGGEVDSGNALVVSVDKQGTNSTVEVEKAATGSWAFEVRSWEVADAADVDAVLAELREYPVKDRTVIKYALTGTLGLEATGTLQRGLEALEPVFAALYPRERLMSLHLEPGAEEMENLPLTGYARDAMRELVELAAAPGADTQAAKDAVNLLFRLSKEAN
ncbi:metallophosphoesterase family protein [Corynebacterium bouchesdurhonense]|uniref:metallophosphoesterase family protein n=1 Tax=Corynebacterium bouchesdurhonense TaxID=1720192 RepID=UPI0008378A8F|nr:DNA repair exonuclease [Corynebacterium bouchesdurhonense]